MSERASFSNVDRSPNPGDYIDYLKSFDQDNSSLMLDQDLELMFQEWLIKLENLGK